LQELERYDIKFYAFLTFSEILHCKTAIDIVINRYKVDRHAHVLGRVKSHLRALCDLNVAVTLIWIPGHSDIYHNELADCSAKNTMTYLPLQN